MKSSNTNTKTTRFNVVRVTNKQLNKHAPLSPTIHKRNSSCNSKKEYKSLNIQFTNNTHKQQSFKETIELFKSSSFDPKMNETE